MRVLFASSEIFPLAKTGGLADVSAGLPSALGQYGVDIRLVMPGYPEAIDRAEGRGKRIPLGNLLGTGEVALIPARSAETGLPLWLVECPALFGRQGGLYADQYGREWPDNADRFAAVCHAAARIALGSAVPTWRADVVHANDWHLGLVPALLAFQPKPRPATVFTIHNLAFQGLFPADVFPRLGLPSECFSADGMEFYGQVSFLKAGIRYADRISTVSPRYAQEILTPEFGCGLDGVLRSRANDLVGILNGVDYSTWDPSDADSLPRAYSADDLSGKDACKESLQRELGLVGNENAPLFLFMSRITEQKMADVLPAVVPSIIERGGQVAVCGKGEAKLEAALHSLSERHAGRVSVHIGYNEPLAKRALAGADVVLAPARFEPCGLTQMYAMRYGALPVSRRVGGLADTVADGEGAATGFLFEDATATDFKGAIHRACSAYANTASWKRMQRHAMTQDFGWRRSAERYLALYRELPPSGGAKRGDAAAAERARRAAAAVAAANSDAAIPAPWVATSTAPLPAAVSRP
ncbi:MAG: glycogen synthase GlgA [Gemmatimonas sp.]